MSILDKYVAIRHFTDLTDNETAYDIGTLFPREGVEVSDERLKKLSTSANAQGKPVIVKVNELSPKEIQETNYEAMTVMQLKEFADKENVEYPSNAVKKELIELLKG